METYIKVEDLDILVAKQFQNKDLITVKDLTSLIYDLLIEQMNLEEKISDLEHDSEGNLWNI